MSLFETILIILIAAYLVFNIYFSISDRVIRKKVREEDLEYADKNLQWEEQVKVLTKRLGEIASENHTLGANLKTWQDAYASLKKENDALRAERLVEMKPKKVTREKKSTEQVDEK